MRVRLIYAWITGAGLLLGLLILVQLIWLRKAAAMEKNERNIHIMSALERVNYRLSHSQNSFSGYSRTHISNGERFYMIREHAASSAAAGRDTLTILYDPSGGYPANAILKEKVRRYKQPVSLEVQLDFRLTGRLADTARHDTQDVTSYKDIISNNLVIEELVDTAAVDEAVTRALGEEHLTRTGYGLGILSTANGRVCYAKRVRDTAALLASPYCVNLFRDNQFIRPYRLALVFHAAPGIYGITWGLTASIIIILLLTVAFLAAIRLYLRQRRLSDMKHDFIHNLTHEFNTPMANISLAVETLKDQEAARYPRMQRMLDIIHMESLRLQENIARALQVASMEKGSLQLHKTTFDLVQLLQSVVTAYAWQCEQLGGYIRFTHPDTVLVSGDAIHLANCFGNMADNALKYRRGEPFIDFRLTVSGSDIVVTITDNGRGMDARTARHVFDPFFRADTGATHTTKGFGLGLNYVRSMVLLHGGNITLRSREGTGTTFTIQLPILAHGNS